MTETQILWCIIIAQQIMLCVLYVFSEWSHRVGILIGHACSMHPGSFPKARAIINKSLAKFGLPLIAVLLACTAALAEIPRRTEPIHDRASKIERNTIHTDDGTARFTQIIVDDDTAIVGWRQVNRTMTTRRDNGGWLTTWVETDGTLRAVWSREFEEVHTGGDWDREVTERAWTPECQRRGLIKPTVRKTTK